MFVDSTGAAPNPRLSAGSLFTAERLGYARYTDGGQEQIVFASSDNGGASPRTAGDHTIYAGQTATGRIDYRADGDWSSTDFLIGHGAPFAFRHVLLRWRCSPTPSVTWELQCGRVGRRPRSTRSPPATTTTTTSPEITITTPTDGAEYEVGESVTADYECTDATGVATCDGPVADGAAIDTSQAGDHQFTVDAEDDIGNQASLTHDYTVLDVTAPTVTITTPEDGAFYYQGEFVEADYTCADDEPGSSGLASCVGTVDEALGSTPPSRVSTSSR